MRIKIDFFTPILLILFMAGCSKKMVSSKADIGYVKSQLEKLAPVTLSGDLSYLPDKEVEVLKLLVKAAKQMDEIFLLQVYKDNPIILEELKKSVNPEDKDFLDLFTIMFGPWDRLEADRPFINDLEKPLGANFYPADMTKKEFEQWVVDHPEDKDFFENEFTVIRRQTDKLIAIPYSEFFKKELKKASVLLKKAASLTSDTTLTTFLNSRADAFLSNDYYQSDMDWMDLAGDIEIVIGPYEVYEDGLFGYKAAFESFVCVVDHEESEKLQVISQTLNDMEKNLPIPDKYKNLNRGSSSPFKVVNEIFTGGDTKAAVQTLAFNLPNDERVREAKGSKKVMLKNIMQAKFDKILMPIAEKVVVDKDVKRISFDGYFNHILLHEVSHGLGPGKITINGEETTVNKELKDLYSIIEEAKADVLGMLNTQYLIDQKIFPKTLENELYASNLGGMFRSIRFGIGSAHGGGVAIQLNYYLEKGAFKIERDGRFSVNDWHMKTVVKSLAKELLLIEATGDYEKAKQFMDKYCLVRPDVQTALDKLIDIPVDIKPVYSIEDEL